MNAEQQRILEDRDGKNPWRAFGPYLSLLFRLALLQRALFHVLILSFILRRPFRRGFYL
ncbi:hypothetical protein HG15A2_40710 [Adhaeretor mobilis]|uniref:Uncharacterized protein n=1 Tax=Adhaeretor mobilis TaxID=1930276 RepID=A0A517N0R6_9BACT|nr:hypothetical protein HG15A2_40710 [Adhaeretor mobilis]